ncbi:hypothetical protein C6N75_00045 [Streptomyces solincola]|uniref:Uncharacterized protein n=1 Tax=Streptomyces solincola TaxID=2100817 RepID=A0A2S9Q3D6_9ACTN|nr:hypothetical protein [Streptomyces solincola]PRH81194.1 hypothetical protein C6N75_00045 [Streptomyces solincola]
MDYAYAVKNLPQPAADPAAGTPAAPPPPEMQPPQEDDARPWAGDVYDEGDETDPAQAYAALSGPNGEQAWLDKAEDGTLTGWVRDETGQVWRYSDPDTWAIDVDDAGMQETGGNHGEPPADGTQDPAVVDPAATDPGALPPGDVEPLDLGTADEAVDPAADAEAPADPAEEDPAAEPAEDSDGEEDPDADEDDPAKKKGGKPPWK